MRITTQCHKDNLKFKYDLDYTNTWMFNIITVYIFVLNLVQHYPDYLHIILYIRKYINILPVFRVPREGDGRMHQSTDEGRMHQSTDTKKLHGEGTNRHTDIATR